MTEESAGEVTAVADQAIGLIVEELTQLHLAIHEFRPDGESAHRLVELLKAVAVSRSQADSHGHDIYEPGREVAALLMTVEQELTRQGELPPFLRTRTVWGLMAPVKGKMYACTGTCRVS